MASPKALRSPDLRNGAFHRSKGGCASVTDRMHRAKLRKCLDGSRHRRVARQGQDDQQVPGEKLRGLRFVRPHPGPSVEGRLRRPRRRFRDDLGRRREVGEADGRYRQGRQRLRRRDPRDRSRSRGRGDLLARAGGSEEQEGSEGREGQPGDLQRHHQERRQRSHGQAARDRRGTRRRLSRPPRARLSRRFHALAGALAQAAGRPLGRPRAVGDVAHHLRARARDREVRQTRILVDQRRVGDEERQSVPRAPRRRRRREARPARHRQRGPGPRAPGRAREGRLFRHQGRGQAGAAQSLAAVHHLDHAAGGEPQARLRAEPPPPAAGGSIPNRVRRPAAPSSATATG